MTRMLKIGVLITLMSVLSTPFAFAQSAVPALRDDAADYAKTLGVDLDEAVKRLQLQDEIGAINAHLYQEKRDSFAGLWIEHTPEFRVIVRFTETTDSAAKNNLSRAFDELAVQGLLDETTLSPRALDSLFVVRPAERSIAELEGAQTAVHHLLSLQGGRFDSEINLVENRVEVFALDTDSLMNRLQVAKANLPDGVEIFPTDALLETEQAMLTGGEDMSTCTTGFNVRDNDNQELGTLTAAHCGNVQVVLGVSLPFRGQDISGNQDVQWHSACDLLDVTDDFDSGIGIRDVTGIRTRNQQAVGSHVCKNGMTTGRTCGFIESTSVAPGAAVVNPQSTFVRVGNGGADLSNNGDSGGPWFVENLAYGIHHGGFNGGANDGDAVYMPINFITSLGVSVLTTDPGNCNIFIPCTQGASCTGHDDCGGTSQGFCTSWGSCVCPF